jgi:hypothetical protein
MPDDGRSVSPLAQATVPAGDRPAGPRGARRIAAALLVLVATLAFPLGLTLPLITPTGSTS